VDVGSALAAAPAASNAPISASSLSSYYSLLPPDARPVEASRQHIFDAAATSTDMEQVVEHSPLRTKLKSDSKHAVRTDRE